METMGILVCVIQLMRQTVRNGQRSLSYRCLFRVYGAIGLSLPVTAVVWLVAAAGVAIRLPDTSAQGVPASVANKGLLHQAEHISSNSNRHLTHPHNTPPRSSLARLVVALPRT